MRTRCIACSIAAAASLAPSLHAQCPAVARAVLTASDAQAQDRYGYSVAVSGDTAIIGARHNELFGLTQLGAAYVVERNLGGPNTWGERKLLTPSDLAAQSEFGSRVELQGDTAAVSRTWDPITNNGSIYLFERNLGGANNWGERVKLNSDPSYGPSGLFAQAFDFDGDTLAAWSLSGVAGQAGEVSIFERNAGGPDQWGLTSHVVLPEVATNSTWIASVSLDGDTLAVGDGYPYEAVYVYERNLGGAGAWGWRQTIPPVWSNPGQFGASVAIEGDALLVGAPKAWYFGGPALTVNCGLTYVFERSGIGAPFALLKTLRPSQPHPSASFGVAVEIDGGRAVIGASTDSQPVNNQGGSAWLFERDFGGPANWGERSSLIASDETVNDHFGTDVAIDGDTVIVGAPLRGQSTNTNNGAAYVWLLQGSAPESYCTAGTSFNGCTGRR